MPELPDVEVFKRYVDSTSLSQEITHIKIKDDSLLNIAPQTLRKHAKSQSFHKTDRIGKHLFLSLGDKWLMMHFGMTGTVQYGHDDDSLPDHTRVLFEFKNGAHLAYDCQRKLGKIAITKSPDIFAKKHGLGPDALDIKLKKFREILSNKRGMIKSALMDQNTISGIGNVYSDEMLYQSTIHPKTKTADLSDEQVKNLHRNMRRILKTAINNEGKPEEMPDHYLIANREEGANCPDCGGSINRIKVSGRGCYICPNCQKK